MLLVSSGGIRVFMSGPLWLWLFTESQKIILCIAHLKNIEAQTFDHFSIIFTHTPPMLQCFINAGVLADKGEG